MKKFIMSIASCLFVFAAVAQDKGYDKDKEKNKDKTGKQDKTTRQDQDTSKTYCFSTKEDGKRVVMSGDEEVTRDVKLSNGTTIKSDGSVTKKDGTKITLKENECVDLNGEIVDSRRNQPFKKDDEMDYEDGPK
jgi:uncharacterized protein YdeI (BOF family)